MHLEKNKLPESWRTLLLKDIADLNGGGTPDRKRTSFFEGNIPWITGADLEEDSITHVKKAREYITEIAINASSTRKVPEGTILITSRVNVGKVGIAETSLCFSQDITSIEIKNKDIIDSEYLAFYLFTNREKLLRFNQGTTISGILRKDLEKFIIYLPTLPEQREIVKILQQTEDLGKNLKLIDEKINKLKASLFNYIFGEPFQNSKNWKTTLLENVITEPPKDGPHESPKYVEKGVPFLSTRNIKPGKVIWDDLKHISRTDAEKYWKKTKPKQGDILYTKGGTTGYAKVIDFEQEIAIWVHLALLKPDKTKVNSIWLEQMLNTDFCYFQSQKFTRGVTNKDLGLQRMVKIKIIIPPLELQEKFADIVQQINSVLEKQTLSKEKISNLNRNLKIQVFTGQLTQLFRQKENFAISTYAKQRDETLKIKSTSDLSVELEQTTNALQNIISYLSNEQKEILESFETKEGYFLLENGFSDLDLPPNQVQRNLELLAEIGLIKSVNIPIAPGEIGNVFYTHAYRSLKKEDDTKNVDLDSLEKQAKI